MNALERRLSLTNNGLYQLFLKTTESVTQLLQQYIRNFPTYTDHSIEHTMEVMNLASVLLNDQEIDNLNADEIYILMMACILHDIGMCIPENKIEQLCKNDEFSAYLKHYKDAPMETYLRDMHHIFSYNFIIEEWENLHIPTEKYAQAIGLIAQGHRKVDISDFEIYDPRYFVKSGRETVCLPYLACVIRIADELDITHMRTPHILTKYYIPDNEVSQREFRKHQATMQVNFLNDRVVVEAKCTDHNILAALEDQFEKIQNVISNGQKIIRSISQIDNRNFLLAVSKVEPKYLFQDFDPKGIKYSFDVTNVINAFVGKDLYSNHNAALREAIQNGIDACNYKKATHPTYNQELVINIFDDSISISDNGQGMDEFIIERYFGRLASSYYEQESIKSDFQAIGQFGIGVFSYFLMADYIEVETKASNKQSLKFRTDQDPKGYFHFFDKFSKDQDGTNLILYLKDEFKGKITFDYVEKFIRKNFPYIDFPIHLKDNNQFIKISKDSFDIDFEKDAYPKMFISSQEDKERLNLLSTYILNEDFEGVAGIIVPANKNLAHLNLRTLFNNDDFYCKNHMSYSQLKISQKGVHINKYGGRSSFLIGKVNLIKKLNVNLSRSEFRNDKEIEDIIEVFESSLMSKFFSEYLPSIGVTVPIEKAKFTNWYLENILDYLFFSSESPMDLMKELFVFKFFDGSSNKYLNVNKIKDQFKCFLIWQPASKVPKSIAHESAIYLPYKNYYTSISLISNVFKYGVTIKEIDSNYYEFADEVHFLEIEETQIKLSDIFDRYFYLNYIESGKTMINLMDLGVRKRDSNLRHDSTRLNYDCDFIKQTKINYLIIKKNSSAIKLVQEVIETIRLHLYKEFKDRKDKTETVDKVNLLIDRLNLIENLNFKRFTLEDF